jgi:hypothetical protein
VQIHERISRYIDRCEPAEAGKCGHNSTFAVACTLTWGFGLPIEDAWPYALAYNQRCMPPWSKRDLRRKLAQALTHTGHTKPRGHLLGASVAYAPLAHEALPKLAPTWTAPDLEVIDKIVSSGPSLYDLWEQSPIRFEDGNSHAEEVVDTLLPGDPLLCVGKSSYEFATRRREVWRGKLASLPLLCPNPMVSVYGKTQDGKLSEHTKSATCRRIYLVVEFDFAEYDKNGKDTLCAPIIRN